MPRPLAANDSDRSALCALVHHCRDRHESALRKAVAALAEISDVGLPHDFNHDNAIAALAEIAQILTGETP
jgi:hypothetical protein